ncbi:DUF3052 domain-containing protein [Cytobacillus suaedae]|nr:DUF3052 domain-containing protein [Cytobacillus suaedae]
MALEILKKLNYKDQGQPVLILNAPTSYQEVMKAFEGEVHTEQLAESYHFIQVFGTSNEEIRTASRNAVDYLVEDGLLWLCYPKKSSKTYKGSDCSRETVAGLLASEGYEPVRQVAIDEDWSALRFRKPDKIKKMVRTFAVTEEGKQRTEQK